MFDRLLVLCGIVTAFTAVPVAAQSAPVPRIVAVGDLHGDFTAWRDVARAARLIDAKGKWAGGNTVFVQTGDVPDRGPDSLKIIDDLMRLQREAPRAGGRVVALAGNHEAMNMTDDLRYVSPGEFAAFTDRNSAAVRERAYAASAPAILAAYRQRDSAMTPAAAKAAWLAATPLGQIELRVAWGPTGRIGRWVVGNPAVAVIDGTIFLHGGLSPAYAKVPVAEINRRVAASLKARETAPEAIINADDGPLWYRGLAMPPKTAPVPLTQEIDQLLAATGAKRIVIGHTPMLNGIVIAEAGRLIMIDTGISSAYNGQPSYLEILNGNPVAHAVTRTVLTQGGAKQ